jgi:hypothetical protein
MTITARYPGKCIVCGGPVAPGEQIEWNKAQKTVAHAQCPAGDAPAAPHVTAFPPTPEQKTALDIFATGQSMAIKAGAGTGKTSTLMMLAQSTTRRGQYLAFNKAIVAESRGKFPPNVTCSTAHSLAYANATPTMKRRLKDSRRMRSEEIAARLNVGPIGFDHAGVEGGPKVLSAAFLAGLVMRAITNFCQSADDEPIARHVPLVDGLDAPGEYTLNNSLSRQLLPVVRRAWDDLMSERGQLPFKHDHYLKAWQLSGPRIQADFILFDEAQDANPVMVAIVAAQTHAQLVWVGDSNQQIYSFTGAINALENVPADQQAFLTQSFRFGAAVAEVANDLLDRLDADLRVVGWQQINSTVAEVAEPDAILCRTNATAVRNVMTAQSLGQRPHLVGGGEQVVRFAKAARDLMVGVGTDHPDLACFANWGEVQSYVSEDEQGGELQLLVKLVDEFGVDAILRTLDNMAREADADVVVSTAHKAKGREWDTVQLAGDFPDQASGEELRLLYVAVTRAKLTLDITAVAALEGGAAFMAGGAS